MAMPSFAVIGEVQQLFLRVVETDESGIRLKYFTDLISDQVDDRLEVKLSSQPLLHAVNDRQLGGALLGFFEQALCLVEETGVLQGDRQAIGECLQQTHIRFAECMFAVQVSDINHASDCVSHEQWYINCRVRQVEVAWVDCAN